MHSFAIINPKKRTDIIAKYNLIIIFDKQLFQKQGEYSSIIKKIIKKQNPPCSSPKTSIIRAKKYMNLITCREYIYNPLNITFTKIK